MSDPVVALAVDEAVALRLNYAEQAEQKRMRVGGPKGEIPPGQRYESTEEILATTGYVN